MGSCCMPLMIFCVSCDREDIINRLRSGELWILITTDLLARGMDFKGIKLVVNYDFPQSMVSYVHRIGRTGRAGKSGEAVTFYTEDDVVSVLLSPMD